MIEKKVYTSFGGYRNRYVCRSEIDFKLLDELKVSGVVSVKEAKEAFDLAVDYGEYDIFLLGSQFDPKRRRHVKFIKKDILLMAINKHLKG